MFEFLITERQPLEAQAPGHFSKGILIAMGRTPQSPVIVVVPGEGSLPVTSLEERVFPDEQSFQVVTLSGYDDECSCRDFVSYDQSVKFRTCPD